MIIETTLMFTLTLVAITVVGHAIAAIPALSCTLPSPTCVD